MLRQQDDFRLNQSGRPSTPIATIAHTVAISGYVRFTVAENVCRCWADSCVPKCHVEEVAMSWSVTSIIERDCLLPAPSPDARSPISLEAFGADGGLANRRQDSIHDHYVSCLRSSLSEWFPCVTARYWSVMFRSSTVKFASAKPYLTTEPG